MSLRFTLNGSTRVDSTTNTASFPDVCTILTWIFPTTIDATYQSVIEKTPSGYSDYRGFGINGTTGEVAAFMRRGSPGYTAIEVVKTGLLVANKWQFVGVQMDASGTVAADQKIFYATEKSHAAEVHSYTTQDPGSGATSPSATAPLVIGNNAGSSYTEGFPGLIHCVGIWGRKMDISEIRYWKQMMQAGKFRPSANNAFFMYLGRDIGPQIDLSGNNFHGTVSGALPVASRPTVSERFFAPWAGTVAAGGGTAYSLTAANASFALSSQTAALKAGRKIAAGQGSFVQAGQTAILKTGRQIVSAQGSFTQSGQNAGLNVARKVAAGQASFALTGQTAALLRSYLLASGVGAFTENAQNVGFPISRKVAAQQASFALDGQTAAFVVNRLLSAVNGSFALAGQSAVFNSARTMSAAQGIFTLSGQIAALLKGKRLSVDAGTFAVSGQNASFQSARRLAAENGGLSLSGQDAGLKRSLMITCSNGVYSVNGQTAAMYRARTMPAAAGSFAATGQTAVMRRSVNLAAGYGAFALTGQAVQFRSSTDYVFRFPVYVTVGRGETFATVSSGETTASVRSGETFVTVEVE